LSASSPAQSGAGVRFKITSLDASGTAAGSTSITKNGLDATFNTFSIFASLPTVTRLSFDGDNTITSDNQVVSLYKFKISADSAGPIGLYKFTFGIATSSVNLCNDATNVSDTTGYYLYISDSESTLGDVVSRGSATSKADMVAVASGSSLNQVILETYFDVNDDDSTGTAQEQLIINAGDTKYFTLRGTIASGYDPPTTEANSISTVMAGDASFGATTLKKADDVDAVDQDDFIWTDLNADLYSSSTATNTIMYVNGYRVPGMPTASTTAQVVSN